MGHVTVAEPSACSDPPAVSAVMSVFDGSRFLDPAVESVLAQSLGDLELIVVDDGSRDGTAEHLRRWAERDSRVRVVTNETNLGQAGALNRGLDLARGQLIARMDADDLADPRRFAVQAEFLRAHPEVCIVGSSVRVIDDEGEETGVWRLPATDLEIRWRSLLGNPFMHPSVMMRAEVLAEHRLLYQEDLRTAQDYELWTRLLRHGRGANLAEPLLSYRHRPPTPGPRRLDQLANQDRIALRTIREQLPDFSIEPEEVSRLRSLFVGGGKHPKVEPRDYVALCTLYLDLADAFLALHRRESGRRPVRRAVAARVVRRLREAPVERAWLATAWRAVRRDRRWLRPLLGHLRRSL